MTGFFEFMFRDAQTAWGMAIFILACLMIVFSGVRGIFKGNTEA